MHDYEPVSAALTAYELAYRDWRLGRLATKDLDGRRAAYRLVVARALDKLRHDRATGETVRAKGLLERALADRFRSLGAEPGSRDYRRNWNSSESSARAALTVLQDIRDRARLIPLPEDAIS
jgi:hypothetical protein